MTAPAALREIPIAGGWDTPESGAVASAKTQYVDGRITAEELELRLEPILLREAPRGHPVPEGWKPLPPCDHMWIDMTALGDARTRSICGHCGDESFT